MKQILLILIFQITLNGAISEKNIRGVSPEKLSLYDSNKPFACLDGSGVIPFNQVNDDYCDCRDGSDEPGTSACLNSSFACENLGYIVQLIPSSRVNDGICDCCDGSDEYSGKVLCENKCIALANKMKEEKEKMRKLREEGFSKRQELINQGNELKKSLENKLKEFEDKKVNLEVERAKLEEIKNQAEQKANDAKEVQDKIFEEKAKELQKIETARKAKALFELLDLDKDLLIKPEELLNRPELDILFDNDGQFTIEESIRLLDQNNHVDLELFVTTYYEKISPHVKLEEVQKEELKTDDEHHEDGSEEVHQENDDHEHGQEQEHHEQEDVTDNKYDEETQNLIKQAEEAQRTFENTDRELRDIEREISDSKKKLELDLGPNAEFASMIDKCFEHEDREYIYKLCPFDKTIQKSKSSHSETSIGNWRSWGDDTNKKYFSMVFDNGLACWNGPQRSTKVIISCGTENKLTAVSEPNRCEYEMKFETPAVCEQNNPEYTHQEL